MSCAYTNQAWFGEDILYAGIGTDNPQHNFTIFFEDTPAYSSPVQFGIDTTSSQVNLGTWSSYPLVFYINGSESCRVTSNTISTPLAAFDFLNTTVSTVNAFGASTALTMGASTGTATINNPTVVGTQPTVNLWNTTSSTVNAFGAANAINMGVNAASPSTLTIGPSASNNTVKINSTTTGTINHTSDITTGTVNLYSDVMSGTVNVGTEQSTAKLGTTVVNGQLYISSNSVPEGVEVPSTSATVVSEYLITDYRSGKFTVQTKCVSGFFRNQYQIDEIIQVHNNFSSFIYNYTGVNTTSATTLVTFTTLVSGGSARLLAQAALSGSTVRVKVARYLNTDFVNI